MDSKLLSIGITSYKRVDELIRCIKSINTKYVDDIEILVSEDHSPLSEEIKCAVQKVSNEIPYSLRFTTNEKNLGYDMNLGAIIQKCNGKYIFFMSDDDAIYKDCLDLIIPFLKKDNHYGVLYAPFVYADSGKRDRYICENNLEIQPGEKNAIKHLTDSILFSGLIFRKKYVELLDSSRFKNHNYFQVYMFLYMIYKYGGYYFCTPSVLCIGDGENAYGIAESSGGNEILANRKSVKSNLEFNKTLFRVIRTFDSDMGTNVMKGFEKIYSFRSYSGLSIARAEGLQYFKEYWEILNNLDIKLYPIAKCYYIILLVLGKKKADRLLSGFKAMVKKE